jgi:hypothetical protein
VGGKRVQELSVGQAGRAMLDLLPGWDGLLPPPLSKIEEGVEYIMLSSVRCWRRTT